jgi:hypothetical protein
LRTDINMTDFAAFIQVDARNDELADKEMYEIN